MLTSTIIDINNHRNPHLDLPHKDEGSALHFVDVYFGACARFRTHQIVWPIKTHFTSIRITYNSSRSLHLISLNQIDEIMYSPHVDNICKCSKI